MTDSETLSDCDKSLMNVDEPIYGDLITEIDLVADTVVDDKEKELDDQNNDPVTETVDLPTEPATFTSTDVLAPDDAVNDFFTVDTKTDDFENEMLIGDLDSAGIDFKNETDVAVCHHEYESKKLLFSDCEDIVEAATVEVEPETIVAESVVIPEENEVIPTENEDKLENAEDCDPCFAIATEEESLNRMHVMEDVEEGCDVSGALPSSPGHAEQRPDPPKPTPELTQTENVQKSEKETTLPASETPPVENGLPAVTPTEELEEEAILTNGNSPQTVESEIKPQEEKETKEELVTEETETKSEKSETLEETSKIVASPEAVPIETEKSIREKEIEPKQENLEEEDSAGSDTSRESSQSNKRKCDTDDLNASPTKKLRSQIQQQYINHDRILSEYIESSNCNTVEDLQIQTEQLLAEIRTLNELAREKEREWNNILHLKKVKEELLLRLQRKKQVLFIGEKNDIDWEISSADQTDQIYDKSKDLSTNKNGNLMMVPVVSSSPAASRTSSRQNSNKPRNILPKTSNISPDLNGQECKQGRQGPILDVRSIIADYRQRHPETVPRRGRRLRSVLNTTHNDIGKMTSSGNVLSMASLALGSGSQVRHGNAADMSNELGLLLSQMEQARQDSSRPSSADSSMTSLLGASSESAAAAAMSFKDVLVQFARLSQSERQELQAQAAATLAAVNVNNKPPPPPYPEVTLHPVPPVAVTATAAQPSAAAAAAAAVTSQNNSLLHGILTKTQPRPDSKPTTFSPTLARLLTAPERVSNNSAQAMYTAALNSGVSISDILSTGGKSRNEITITPVGNYGQNMKHKDGEHLEEDEAEDSADRLVIDEGNEMNAGDRNRTDNSSEAGDEVPQCQGCHQKSAQFVCAGCGNQWYCSRDCQVASWDEHSEVCSG